MQRLVTHTHTFIRMIITRDYGVEILSLLQVVDLLVAMCRAALQSSRKNIIFEPYPSVVDPYNPKTLAFSPKVSDELI